MVRKNVDVCGIRRKRDACLPGSVPEFHFAPVFVGDQFFDVAGATVGWAVHYPKQAGGLGALFLGKRGVNRKNSIANISGNVWDWKHRGNLVEEVVQ